MVTSLEQVSCRTGVARGCNLLVTRGSTRFRAYVLLTRNVTQVTRTQLTWPPQEHLTGDRPLDSYTNVWAIGIIMWGLLQLHEAPEQLPGGQSPLVDCSSGNSSLPPRTATIYRAELDDLVYECLNPDVTRRPTLPDLRRDVRVFLDAYRQSGDLPALGHLPVDTYPVGTPRPPSPNNDEKSDAQDVGSNEEPEGQDANDNQGSGEEDMNDGEDPGEEDDE